MKLVAQIVLVLVVLIGLAAAIVWWWPGEDEVSNAFVLQAEQDGAALGIAVLDANGDLLRSHQSHLGLIPASTLKALTVGVALNRLGGDFRFITRVGGTVALREGAIEGNLMIQGSGDPSLTTDDLAALAEDLLELGVAHIQGDIIADASAYPENPASDHWNWGDVGNAYGAGAYGINVERNRYQVRFNPGNEEGAEAEFTGASFPIPGVEWRNAVRTGPAGSGDGVVVYGGPYSPVIHLRGTVPRGEPGFTVGAAIPDPPLLAATILYDLLRDAGVEITGRPTTNRKTTHFEIAEILVEHESPPLTGLARHLLAVSDNIYAQSIFIQSGGKSGFLEYFENLGINIREMRIEDGSGLARANTITAATMATCLRAANADSGGKLRELLSQSMDGRRSSKAGAMSGVRGDVGFLTTHDGEELTYAVIANSLPAGLDFWKLQGEFLQTLIGDAPEPAAPQ